MRRLGIALALVSACDEPQSDAHVERLVVIAGDTDPTTERTAGILHDYLRRMTGTAEVVTTDAADRDALDELLDDHDADLVIVLDGERDAERFSAERLAALGRWGFAIEHETDDDRTMVWLASNGGLARQYAAYELLRRLGARFYHPEAEHVPELTTTQLHALVVRPTVLQPRGDDARPDFEWRSWSFHSAHPLEHLEAFSDGDHPIDEAVHVEDWIVKNKGNRFRGPGRGIASEDAAQRRRAELEQLRASMGFPTGAGITLHNQQQGASADIDPTSPVPVKQQIDAIVAAELAAAPDAEWFGIHFGPTEFTTTPDLETVQWIEWAAAAARALSPDIAIEINDHVTGSQPSPSFADLGCPSGTNPDGRIDYYDLAFHTDPSYGVQVHTVMFYPLEGDARVYEQRSFAHKLCLMERASAEGRPLTYFPEGAWWLSFDNPVPVYLPLHIATRHRDVELLRPLLPKNGGSLVGHRMFDTGHEWGYWQQDYAVGLLAWNAELGLDDVLGELLDPWCPPDEPGCAEKTEMLAVMQELVDLQRELFLERIDARGRPGGLYTYFAGEDQADVIAAASGLEFRPVRPSFADVSELDDQARADLEAIDLAALDEVDARCSDWLARIDALAAATPLAAAPWLAEVVDGIEILGLRARHGAALYRAVLAHAADADGPAAGDALARADVALGDALGVIARREAAYRYPLAQVQGGGLTPETAVPNGTTYGFRVHTKTHLATYWHNRHDEVVAILGGGMPTDPGRVRLRDAIAAIGEPLAATWPELEPLTGTVTVAGIGELAPPATTLETGTATGVFAVDGLLVAGDREIVVTGVVARTGVRARTPREGLTLTEPAAPTAQGVLKSVFPALEWGLADEPMMLVLGHDQDDDGIVDHDAVVRTDVEIDGDSFVAAPITFDVPVALASGGAEIAVTLREAVFTGVLDGGAFTTAVDATGAIEVDDLVAALVELAGFDEAGALETLATLLGFDAAAPPEAVPFAATFSLEPE
jgi:hypothetical protein